MAFRREIACFLQFGVYAHHHLVAVGSWASERTWNAKALRPGEPDWLLDYRRFLDRVAKVCLSNRLESADWENSRIVRGDLARILTELRGERAGTSWSRGSAVVRECLRRNLADDFWFFVMPVV